MRRFVCALLTVLALLLCLGACAGEDGFSPQLPDQPGVQPLPLSEDAAYLLQVFDLDDSAQILALRAPEGAVGLEVTVYRLGDDLAWKKTGGGEVIGGSPEDVSGMFAMELGSGQALSFRLHLGSAAASWGSEAAPSPLAGEAPARRDILLSAFQAMELDQELPVALLLWGGESGLGNPTLEGYGQPALLNGVEQAQAITLRFTSDG